MEAETLMWLRVQYYLTVIGAFFAGVVLVYYKGRSDSRKADAFRKLESEVKAHDRITNADTGIGSTDLERIKRLRDISEKLSD